MPAVGDPVSRADRPWSRYPATFGGFSGRSKEGTKRVGLTDGRSLTLLLIWPAYQPTPRRTAATGETPVLRRRGVPRPWAGSPCHLHTLRRLANRVTFCPRRGESRVFGQ